MTSSSAAKARLLRTLRQVLRPIIRVLIRAGLRFDEFAELARGVYVESALRDGIGHWKLPTRTRISVVTGVARHQVDYYIDNEGALPPSNDSLTPTLAEVLQKWHTDPQYVGPYGIPLELEFDSPSGRSFRSLVELVNNKVSPGIVLEELLRVGSVTYSGEKHFRAVSRYFMMTDPMSAEQIEYFGSVLARLAETLQFNMNPENATKRLERFVIADRGLPVEVLPKFEAYARDRSQQLLLDLDNWLTPYSKPGTEDDGPRVGTGLNVFMYVDPAPDDRPLRSLVQEEGGYEGREGQY
jgi:hypothetical protein